MQQDHGNNSYLNAMSKTIFFLPIADLFRNKSWGFGEEGVLHKSVVFSLLLYLIGWLSSGFVSNGKSVQVLDVSKQIPLIGRILPPPG